MDLLIPSLAPTARKTNYDYTNGQLDDLISVIIEEKAKLFVCAVGVPRKEVVERLHKAGIVCMNVGHLRLCVVNRKWEREEFIKGQVWSRAEEM